MIKSHYKFILNLSISTLNDENCELKHILCDLMGMHYLNRYNWIVEKYKEIILYITVIICAWRNNSSIKFNINILCNRVFMAWIKAKLLLNSCLSRVQYYYLLFLISIVWENMNPSATWIIVLQTKFTVKCNSCCKYCLNKYMNFPYVYYTINPA